MFDHFINGFSLFARALPAEAYAIGFTALLIAAFVGFIFLGRRGAFRTLALLIIALESAFLTAAAGAEAAAIVALLSSALAAAFSLLLEIPHKKRENEERGREIPVEDFVRSLDRKLRSDKRSEERPAMHERDIPSPMLKRDPIKNNFKSLTGTGSYEGAPPVARNINVSHARDLIERLDCMELTAADRAKVREAESSLGELERGGGLSSVLKVNEKLSSLIRILAKYEA